MKVDYPIGTKILVKYFDHNSSDILTDAKPGVNEAMGYFAKSVEIEPSYIVLSQDKEVNDQFLHPFSIILSNEIISISKLIEVSETK